MCFSPELRAGRVDHAACPLLNISVEGMAVEYDQALKIGVAGHVSYRTISHQPVFVGVTVRQCDALATGRFLVGLRLNRRLQFEEIKPALMRPGREISPGIRVRKLRPALAHAT